MAEIAHRTIGFSVTGNFDPLERAQNIMDRLVKQVPQLKRAFNDVNFSDGINKNIKQYEKFSNTMSQTADAHEKAVNKITDQTKRMIDSQSSELDKGKNQVSEFSHSVKDNLKDLPTRKTYRFTVETNGDKVKSDANRIKRSENDVTRSSTKMSQTIREHSGRVVKSFGGMSSISSKLRNATVAAVPGTLTLGAAFGYSANQAVKLQKQYTTIKNLLVTGGEKASHAIANVNKMQSQGRKLSLKYGESQKGISAGYEELVRRGYTSNQALAAQKTLIQGSIASGDKYSDVVHNATAALESFGMRSNNVNKMTQNTKIAVNEMAYAADLTATDFQGMGDALRYVGATAHSTNQSLAETTSAIGILSNNGLEDTQAGTGLRKIMNSFGSPTMTAKSQQGQVMDQLGLKKSDFTDAAGKVKSLADNFKVLNKATSGMSDSEKFNVFHKFFGTTGQEAALILNKNVGQMKALNKQVSASQNQKGGGYVAQLSKKNMNSWQVQLKRFQAALQELGISFAKSVLPEVTAMAKGLTGVVNKFSALPKWAKQWTLNLTLAGAALLPIMAGITTIAANLKMISGSGSLLSMFGKRSAATTTAESVVPDVGSRLGGSHFAAGGSKLAGIASAGKSLLKGYGYLQLADQGIQFGANAVNVFQKGLHGSGVTSAWKMGGQAVGGGIGAFLGGPAGAGIGAQIGGFIAEKLPKAMKNSVKAEQQWSNDPKHGVQKGSVFIPGAGWSFNPRGGSNAVKSTKKTTGSLNGLDSNTKRETKTVQKAFREIQTNWALRVGQINKATGSVANGINKNVYKRLEKSLASYGKEEKKVSASAVKTLEKNGLVSKKAANSLDKQDQKSFQKREKAVKRSLNALSKDEQRGGKQRQKYVAKAEKAITSLMSSGSGKQKIILGRLKDASGKLNNSQAKQAISSSYKSMNKQISAARKTYKGVKDAANKKYKSTVAAADHEYYVTGSLSKKSHDKIVEKARKTRDDQVSAAKEAERGSVTSARTMHDEVVKQVKKMSSGNLSAMNTWTGKAKSIWSKFGDWFSNFWSGLGKLMSKIGGGKAHTKAMKAAMKTGNTAALSMPGYATGTAHAKSGMALVGEAGPELAYSVYGRKARLLGMNGPEFTHVRANEKILNARDTSKSLHGRFGAGRVLPGYAKGTTSLSKDANQSAKKVKKTVSADYSGALKSATKSMKTFNKFNSKTWKNNASTTNKHANQVRKNTTADYLATNKNATSELKSFNKRNQSLWKNTSGDTNHYTNQIRRNSVADYSVMSKDVIHTTNETHKQLNTVWGSIVTDFAHIFNKMKGYMHTAVAGAIGQLNGGISGIDKVLSQFGGNNSVIKPVHYSKGSNGHLGEDQWAMVNDAKSGPRQELILRGNQVLAPQGKDRILPLKRNDQVLNGQQAQEFAAIRGITHFAKGSGVSHHELRKIASNGAKDPSKSFNDNFNVHVKLVKTDLQKGITGAEKHGSSKYGAPWMGAMWNVINDAIGSVSGKGGSREAFLRFAESHYSGHPYRMGSMGPTYYDCSGMVASALKHFGVDIGRTTVAMQTSSGVQSLGKSLKNTVPGDIVVFGHGTGAAGHVGIIKNPRTGSMFNETPPHARVTSIASDKSMGYGYYRIKGLHNAQKSKKKTPGARLEKLAKRELGKPAIKWIKNHLGESSFGSLGSMNLVGDIGTRARELAAGIKKLYPAATNAGIAAVLGNWEFESRLNPGAINPGGGASGLGQWLGGRKTNLINYARKHHMNWKNAAGQLAFAIKGEGSDSSLLRSILRGSGSVSSLAARFSSGWERGGYTAQHVNGARKVEAALSKHANGGWADKPAIFGEAKGQPEVAINPFRKSADSLIIQAMEARSKTAPGSLFGKLASAVHIKRDNDQIKGSLKQTYRKLRHPARITSQQAIQPNITLSPKFVFQGPVTKKDAEYIGNVSTAKLRKMVEQLMDDKFSRGLDVEPKADI